MWDLIKLCEEIPKLTINPLNHISLPPVVSNCDNLIGAASSLLLCVCLMQSLLCWASSSPLTSLLPPLPPALVRHRVSDLLPSCSQPPSLLDSQQPKGSFPCGVFADTLSNPSFLSPSSVGIIFLSLHWFICSKTSFICLFIITLYQFTTEDTVSGMGAGEDPSDVTTAPSDSPKHWHFTFFPYWYPDYHSMPP